VRQVLLLRGVNLGPRNRIAMSALRERLAAAGLADVRTYLQSGNVVVSSDASPDELARECEAQIAEGFGLDISVLVRTGDELAKVVGRNPLAKVAINPKRYQVSFCSVEPDPALVERLAALAVAPEQFVAVGRELFAWHPNGVARSRLWAELGARKLEVTATARNWTTVTTLLAMAEESEADEQ
jgi:uncharacterized protein (DUF1697 family)